MGGHVSIPSHAAARALTIEAASQPAKRSLSRPESIVFVAGPFGPFLRVLANNLRSRNCRVTRLILNGGDLLDWGFRDAAIFKSGPELWGNWVHEQLRRARNAGKAILLVSADLPEVIALSDRVAVMYGGRFVTVMPAGEATTERLGPFMTGAAS